MKNKMKTLADLKRDLNIGDCLTLVEAPTMPEHKYLNKKRYVIKKQGNGVYLNEDKNAQGGSFLEFTNAKMTEYDGKTIKTFMAGNRPLTKYEKEVFENMPSKRPENKEKIEMEMMTDTNGSYYLDVAYLKEKNCSFYFGSGSSRLQYNHNDQTVTDKQLKGKLELSYIINFKGGKK